MNEELLVYLVHAAFWCAFGLTRLVAQQTSGPVRPDDDQPVANESQTARYSRGLLVVHALAFAAMYSGIGTTVFAHRVPSLFAGQRVAGTLVIASGGWLACWALASFKSWRIRAKLDRGHQLATGGPFRLIRHPIYMGLNLLALGSALWIPTPLLWASVALMLVGGDLRARAEEKLLIRVFGATYSEFCRRTKRFLPGIY